MTPIADQLRRAVYGPAWHGDSLFEILDRIPFSTLEQKPRIWEVTLHIAAWLEIVKERSGKPFRVTAARDWPKLRARTQAEWMKTRSRLNAAAMALIAHADSLSGKALMELVPGKEHTVYTELHGVIQHTLYHTGQISVLAKSP